MNSYDKTSSIDEQRFEISNAVRAHYRISSVPYYMGNPLIEALTDYLTYSNNDIDQLLSHELPPCPPNASRRQRDAHLSALTRSLFISLRRHRELQEIVDVMIRTGYSERRVCCTEEYLSYLINCGQLQQEKEQELIQQVRQHNFNYRDGMSAAVVGISGIGKTYAISQILSLYPQVIIHDKIPTLTTFIQIVYLRVECPHDGSVKSLCVAIIAEIDRLVNGNFTDIYVNKGRATASVLKNRVTHLLAVYNVGLLVIDEVQNLLGSRMEREQLFNFIVSLSNTLSVPLLFIGTPKGRKLMQTDLRIARRFGSMGVLSWERLNFKEKDWNTFIAKLWRCNVLPDEDLEQISPEVEKQLFDCSQGITDILVKLFVLAQKMALIYGRSKLTVKLIKSAFDNYFTNVQPMISAIKNNDIKALERYEDIGMLQVNFEEVSHQLTESIAESMLQEGSDVAAQAESSTQKLLNILQRMMPITPEIQKIVELVAAANEGLQTELGSMVKQTLEHVYSDHKMPTAEATATPDKPKRKKRKTTSKASTPKAVTPEQSNDLGEL